MPLFFVSTVMAILPVSTTSKLDAAGINLKHLAQHLGLGYCSNYVKEHGFWPEVGVVFKNFHGRTSASDLMNPPS